METTFIKTILLVDDDLDDQDYFREALRIVDPSITLYTAKDGINAIEQLEKITPDIILLDLNMPRMNGVECLRELKKSEELSDIPVIIYSAFLCTYDRNEVVSMGVRQFIKKEISFKDTVNTIRQALRMAVAERDVASNEAGQPEIAA
ncbi:MAG: response regulator [Bacteroidota bacterium]|nr:response regulator [Bacteroidota bacterium]